MKKPSNDRQALQDKEACEFIVKGVPDWEPIFAVPVQLSIPWSKWCGGTEAPLMTYMEKEAEVNGHSLERSIMHSFLRLGYVLEELEVDIMRDSITAEWGRCVWYREHPNYENPLDDMFEGTAINNSAYYHAMFRTEHAGDQHFCLYSLQMPLSVRMLFHKTLLYRKVVFSPPMTVVQQVAA